MKNLLIAIGVVVAGSATAQTQINLKLNHHFDTESFAYGTEFETADGKKIKFDRIQYYLSGLKLTHDSGQELDLSDTYILANANTTNYDLGSHNLTNLEGIKFDLGVDQANNHNGSSNWPVHHPLAPQSPLMDWGWPAGYFFFVLDGEIDSDGDGATDQTFQLRGLGDELLRNVSPLTVSETGSTIDLNVFVNIADWIRDIDISAAGYQHNASQYNIDLSDNTNDETVFTTNLTSNISETELNNKNNLYVNYQLPYAPTIFYSLKTKKNLSLVIVDMQGKVVISESNLQPEGDFFINRELESGVYSAQFSDGEISESIKFTVTK